MTRQNIDMHPKKHAMMNGVPSYKFYFKEDCYIQIF